MRLSLAHRSARGLAMNTLTGRNDRPKRRGGAASALAIALLVGASSLVVGIAAPASAQTADSYQPQTAYQVQVSQGKSQVLETPGSYTDLMIADPKIADVVPLSEHSVYVVGKAPGSTALTILGPGKRVEAVVNVIVGADIESFKSRLHQVLPDEKDVSALPANESLVLSGTVSSPAALQQTLALAETYAPTKVVNMMGVEGTQQVMLSVRFVEMERTTAKNLRLNLQQTSTNTSPSVTVQTGDTLVNATKSLLDSFGTAALLWKAGGGDLGVLFDGLETKALVKTLAEPNLVAMSGDTASFLAGGEFPIPVSQNSNGNSGGGNTITVEFKQFGISLAFTPTILKDGMINLVVNPEVSSIDPTTAFVQNGLSIPGIKIRRAHTTVELRDGESFTIAGLLGDNYQNNLRAFPFVGDVPVLGALFHSTGFQRDQTELVIVVTPHLVTPRRGPVALPSDHFVPPSDFELFLFGMQRGKPSDVVPEDRVLLSQDPTKGGIEGPYGHVLY
jgi:pilus assembly protein CpaC